MKRRLFGGAVAVACAWCGPGLVGCSSDKPMEPAPSAIAIPAVSVSGHGAGLIGALEFAGGVGSCEIDGVRRRAVVHEVSSWPDLDLTIFHVVAPAADNLHVLYLYAAGDTLRSVWHESYVDGLEFAPASGSVEFNGTTVAVRPTLDALEAGPSAADLVQGLEIDGTGIDYRDGVGSILIDGRPHALYPFEIVDCSDCGASEQDGWLEVHAMTEGRGNDRGFVILYLFASAPGSIDLFYHVRFDPFRCGADAHYAASWSVDGKRHRITSNCAGASPPRLVRGAPRNEMNGQG